MRRTYRSKKDANGALDHKDVLLTMDEKTSVFDAFYIQNIKQTKREMSSVNCLAAPPSKVRKRKYVKRIVKDLEPQKESALDSVYLTPNKSLHVNKPLDPFDQLLNSPSTKRNDSLRVNKSGLFGLKREAKTYRKRKETKLKKYNYSSSDSTDSEKENSSNSKTPDKSNILKHELFIEKGSERSPTCLDKSIKELVQNFSLLKNSSPKTPGKLSRPMKFVKNRLTTNVKSPSENSPLCSTPFKEKYRGASIYKFSPISSKAFNESLELNNSHNDSIKFLEKKKPKLSDLPEKNDSEQILKSPVFKTPDYKGACSLDDCKPYLTQVDPYIPLEQTKLNIDKPEELIKSLKQFNTSESQISSIEISSDIEPFLGFSNNDMNAKEDNSNKNNSIIDNDVETGGNKYNNGNTSVESKGSQNNSDISQYNHSLDNSVMLFSNDYPKENDIGTKGDAVDQHTSDLIVADKETDKQNEELIISNNFTSKLDIKESEITQNQDDVIDNELLEENVQVETDDVQDNLCQILEDISSSLQELDNQSLYDTCDSGDISQADSDVSISKLPIVELKRLNDSVFQNYYSKMPECHEIENSDSCQDSEAYESVDNISNISNNSDLSNSDSANVQKSSDLDTSKDLSNDNDTDSNSNTDEDRCISFVTTRRRNEVTNDSMILAFNDSYGSVSSSECDKTVLSIRNSDRKSDTVGNEATLVNEETRSPVVSIAADAKKDRSRISNVIQSSTRENVSIYEEHNVDVKPSIVLQPGKKWERSLSIYRRMTMNNDHFDQSILEDEPLQTKGRKYRQSVISTMELQDKGLLHNESINSRRSTFVSKPCRSTIRIVKEPNNSRISLCSTAVFDDLKGFLNEDCDDTIVELSKLSIADSEHEITVLETFHDTAGRVATARDYVLRRCNQADVLLFDECYPDTVLKNCHKIGEGVYGEVFLWRARDGRARVMKIVPIAGVTKVNGESQKDYHEIISEIVIAMELSALRAPIAEIDRHFDEGNDIEALDLHAVENATDVFNEVLAVRCVYGSYPSRLLDLWELYDECKGSENDNPAILPVDQQYIVLELANAGQDLESYQFNSAEQAHALFLQVAFALAVGEESFQFEHRDLHWGNVLISPTEQKFATFVLRGRAHRVARRGVAATIIDYSLSRIALPLSPADCAALYNDLAHDDGLFDALGDYQFEVYRRMRDKLGNDWKNFEPYTNILWLHYTVDKMITALRYKRTNTKIHKHYIAKLKGIKNRILDFGSAAQFVLTDNEF